MSITASTLYRDSFNFFRNHTTSILLLALLTAFISVVLNQAFYPDMEQLQRLNTLEGGSIPTGEINFRQLLAQMTPEQQMVLLKLSAVETFSALVGNTLLAGGILTLVRLISEGQSVSVLRALAISAPRLPGLLLLLFICTLLIQLGLMAFVLPGLILAIAFSLSPVIYLTDRERVFSSLKLSAKHAFSNTRLIVPAMMTWLAAKLLLLFMVSYLASFGLSPFITSIVINALSNLLSCLFLIYLFRLSMLLRG